MSKNGNPVIRINPDLKASIEADESIPSSYNNYEINTISDKIAYVYNKYKEANK